MKYDFMQAITIGKTFIIEKYLKEKEEGLAFHRGEWTKSHPRILQVMRKDAKELILEYTRARFSLGVTYFLEDKKSGEFFNFHCLPQAQGSGKMQRCDRVKVSTKGLRKQEFREGCDPLRTIATPLECHMFWSSPSPSQSRKTKLIRHPRS